MSMNLCFASKDGVLFVDFPFQTPTKLTNAVLAETNQEKQLDLIRYYCFHTLEYNVVDLSETMNVIRAWLAYPLEFSEI